LGHREKKKEGHTSRVSVLTKTERQERSEKRGRKKGGQHPMREARPDGKRRMLTSLGLCVLDQKREGGRKKKLDNPFRKSPKGT